MTTVKKAWEQVGKDLSEVGESIKKSGIGEGIAQFGSDLGKSIVTTVKHGIKAVSEWADTIDDKPEKAAENACENAAEAADVIYAEAPAEEAAEAVEEKAEEAAEAVTEAAETVEEKVTEAAEAAEEAVTEAAEAVGETVGEIVEDIKD